MEKFFYKLKNPITSHPELLEYAVKRPSMYWVLLHSFLVTKVPSELYAQDPFVSTILERFNGQAVILQMPARSIYNFHVDSERSVSVNLLLNNFDCSHSYYRVPMTQGGRPSASVDHIVELNYEPGQAYVLNTGETHGVINTGDKPRLVFALSIDKPVKYSDVIEFLKETNI